MRFVEALKRRIAERKIGDPDRWVREWLIPHALNEGRSIPHNAPVTLIVGLQLLFELPYQAITEVVSEMTEASVAPYVCVSDARPTEVLIVDMTLSKIVSFYKHEAWKFRFKTQKALDLWMRDRAVEIAKRMGRISACQILLRK
jgi:hypothetical protein